MRRFGCLFVAVLLLLLPRPSSAVQVQIVSLQARDLILNPTDGRLYASVPGSVPGIGNTVTAIDPATGTIGPSIFVGSEPGKLALADDGRTLYVALGGAAAVRVVDLAAQTAGLQFSLGNDPFYGPYYAEDIAVQPGNPQVVAISLIRPGVSPRHGGVGIFDNGVARAQKTQEHTGSNRIEFASDPSRVYGFNNESTEFGFRRLLVTESGVSEVDVVSNLISGFSSEIYYDHGRVYGSSGEVVDPENLIRIGTFPMPSYAYRYTAAPDGDRAYYLTSGDFFSGGIYLHEFDTNTFTLVLAQALSGAVIGTPGSLTRWGADGLAFRTENQVVLLTRIHEPPTCDMELTQTDSSDPVDRGYPFQYQIMARNLGTSPASDVVVRDVLPSQVSLNYAYSSRGGCTDSSGTLVCNLGAISEGDSAVIQLYVTANSVGTAENVAWVSTSTLDTAPDNNTSHEQTLIREPIFADLGLQMIPSSGAVGAGGALTYTIAVGNAGPNEATDVSLHQSFYGVPTALVSATPQTGTCSVDSGFVSCSLGAVAPGESTRVVVVVVPGETGYLQSSASVGSSVPDPIYFNNYVETYVQVLPSATKLLDDIIALVRGYGLRRGPERNLIGALEAAQAAVEGGDSTEACSQINEFRHRIGRMAGRQLTLSQAVRLDADANEVAGILHCAGASLAARLESPGAMSGSLSLRTVSRPGDAVSTVTLNLPAAGRVRLDVFDVTGRLVRTTLDQDLPVGSHELRWDGRGRDGSRASAGVYFVKARWQQEQVVSRITLLR